MNGKPGRPRAEKHLFARCRGRPRKENKKVTICLTLPIPLVKALKKIAKKEHKSFSSTIVGIIEQARDT